MSVHRFKYLFQQFISNNASREEKGEFFALLNKDDYDKEVKGLLDEFWIESTNAFHPISEEKTEKLFRQVLSVSEGVENDTPVGSIRKYWLSAAAAVLILGAASFFYYQKIAPLDQKLVGKETQNASPIPQRRVISLPDGSSVVLNENSSVEFISDFKTSRNRELILFGEAYFDIIHDKNRPFIVHTGKLRTTVLGTAFNIKASPGNETVVVTVTRGKVKVGDSTHTFNVIVPDEQVTFTSEQAFHVKKLVKAQDFTSWMGEDLYFDDASLKDISSRLQERFGVNILFSNDNVKTCRFSATFLKTQSLEQILNIIAEFNDITYKFQNKNTVLLDGKGCNRGDIK